MQCQKGIKRNHYAVFAMLRNVLALTRTHISIVIVISVASLWPQHIFWEDLVELGDQILSEVHVCEQTHASLYFTRQEKKVTVMKPIMHLFKCNFSKVLG